MAAKHICPAQIRKNIFDFLMCEFQKKDGVDYNLKDNARGIMCVNQHYCPCTKRNENTADYKACYENLKNQRSAEPEEKPAETKTKGKTTRKKASK